MAGTEPRIRRANPADASGIANVYVRTWRSAYRRLLPPGLLRAMSETTETLRWWTSLCEQEHGSATLVAEDDASGIVGFTSGGRQRGSRIGRAEIYTLYVLPQFQRRRLGTALVADAARRFGTFGYSSLIIWVLASNPAREFYEGLGGHPHAARTIRLGGRHVQEVAYIWPNFDEIAAAASRAASRR